MALERLCGSGVYYENGNSPSFMVMTNENGNSPLFMVMTNENGNSSGTERLWEVVSIMKIGIVPCLWY